MKKLLQCILGGIPVVRNYYAGRGAIFTMHRVSGLDDNRLKANENLKISPQFLEAWIIQLKAAGYSFVSLDTLCQNVVSQKECSKQIVCTLDDGYADNFSIAYPIFKKHNIPFTIYITTAFPEKTAILWWYGLEDCVLNNTNIILSNGQVFDTGTPALKLQSFLEIRDIILTLDQSNLLAELRSLFHMYEIPWESYVHELALSWKEIVDLSTDPLVTIGSHTHSHPALNQLSIGDAIQEITHANDLLRHHIGRNIDHFAYPFGSENEVGIREFNILKKMGMRSATTTRRGTVYGRHRSTMYALPRIELTEAFRIRDIGRVRKKRIVTV